MTLQPETESLPPDPWSIGAILYSSWGYDQTNIDFYQIVDRSKTGATVVVRKIAAVVVDQARGADYLMPHPDNFDGEPIRKRVNRRDDSIRVSDYGTRAYPWDGRRKYQTASGYGH